MSLFTDDVKIDPLQLDVEAVRQPRLMMKWAEKYAEARKTSDEAKLQLDIKEAEIKTDIRKEPEKFGINKVTEASVDEAMKRHPVFQAYSKNLIQARYDAAIMEKAVNTMEQRKRMLEVLVELHKQEYFAGPSSPRNLAELFVEGEEKVRSETLGRQKKKVRKRSND